MKLETDTIHLTHKDLKYSKGRHQYLFRIFNNTMGF